MRIAHLSTIAPHRSGLYGTARDIVAAERKQGADARLVDIAKSQKGVVDGVPVATHQWAAHCDAWIAHSGFGKALEPDGRPVVHIMHGRPYSSYLLGLAEGNRVYDYLLAIADKPEYVAFVTLWKEYLPYWAHLLPDDKLHALAPPVDLEAWKSDGPSGYGFHGDKGGVNIVIADSWREDQNPHPAIHAFSIYAHRTPQARLHIYGAPVKNKGFDAILKPLRARGVLGEVKPHIKGLENVYRAADAVLTPHSIATRVVREALACGAQVVMGAGNDFSPYVVADVSDIAAFALAIQCAVEERQADADGMRARNRESARNHFDSARTAEGLLALLKDQTDA